MIIRRAAAVALAASVLFGASACTTAEPDPTPTPPFASEAEAFAAAEATYRAYVDALNGVDLSDPETFEPLLATTTGEFEADERKTLSQLHADGWAVKGESVVERVDQLATGEGEALIGACLRVDSVELVDSAGRSQVSSDRPPVQSLRITLVPSTDGSRLLISDIEGAELHPPCV